MAIIGIDLGTSNSAAAVLRGGRPVIIPSAEGITLDGKAFPSYVAITADGQMIVGEPARRQAVANAAGTTTGFKRQMGQRVKIKLRDLEYSPEQLSAVLLQKIKRDAESFLGEQVRKVVVTVPAYFNDNQRAATKDACGIAKRGLLVRHLVLPNGIAGTEDVMRFLARNISPNTYVNIMGQYRPCYRAGETPELNRPVSSKEYAEALAEARAEGLQRCEHDPEASWLVHWVH
ncbi:MAG: Hsp70 family protein [Rhodospirillales bacterium]|nr:Hsp70 family protein [Rhodospirillales bacterium]